MAGHKLVLLSELSSHLLSQQAEGFQNVRSFSVVCFVGESNFPDELKFVGHAFKKALYQLRTRCVKFHNTLGTGVPQLSIPFEVDASPSFSRSINGTVERDIPPPQSTSALVLPSQVETKLQDELEKLRLNMELKWEEERKKRDEWKAEDAQDNFRNRVTAMLAAAILSEGAAGNRPRADQLATMAVEYADAVLLELRKKK